MAPMKERMIHIRPGFPDFIDLPWDTPIRDWKTVCENQVEVEIGLSRHPLCFVHYEDRIFCIKELPTADLAEKEYENLRALEKKELPSVEPVGYVRLDNGEEPTSALITTYLDLSLPFRSLFAKPGMERYQERLFDSIACLLVRLHLAGVFWGDCSLSNVLFRREAGELGAYVVDVETTKIFEELSDGHRKEDLLITEENVYGELTDLALAHEALREAPVREMALNITDRYERLWKEINVEVFISKHERYKIQERVKVLNNMGFSVDEIELFDLGNHDQLRLRTVVTDQSYHRHLLHSLTGLVAKDNEARYMMNEINELRATLCSQKNRSVSISVAAFQWLNDVFYPCSQILRKHSLAGEDIGGLYVQLLEHKWLLSERMGKDVGIEASLQDFVETIQKPRRSQGLTIVAI